MSAVKARLPLPTRDQRVPVDGRGVRQRQRLQDQQGKDDA
jgi:hypothetical protein